VREAATKTSLSPPNTSKTVYNIGIMGRELQKKKNRSSTAKVRQQKPKAAKKAMKKKILANPIIAANWYQVPPPFIIKYPTNRPSSRDHTQTLSQNYTRLGLARKLNAPTGGIERNPVGGITNPATNATLQQSRDQSTDSLAIASSSSRKNASLIPRDVRIERDPETGAILRVLEDSSSESESQGAASNKSGSKRKKKKSRTTPWKPLNDPLAAYDSDSNSSSTSSFASFHSSTSNDNRPINTTTMRHHAPNQHHLPSATSLADMQNERSANPSSVVAQLAAHAKATTVKPRRRTVSVREEDWMRRLVERHGEDYGAMVRDKELNVRQQTRGDIERRVRRWREGGGR